MDASVAVDRAEQAYLHNPNPTTKNVWIDPQHFFRTVQHQQAENKRSFSSQTFFEEGEKKETDTCWQL